MEEAATYFPTPSNSWREEQRRNTIKERKDAFWEDRYHATAVECDTHLTKCITHIDLNMVRNGVVKHPSKWECCGYHEIQSPRQRYDTIDHTTLKKLFQLTDCNELAQAHQKWVEEALKTTRSIREPQWTESIAVGTQPFLQGIHAKLKLRERGRQILDAGTGSNLR